MRRAKAREPVTLVRSPTLTKSEPSPMLSGSSPERRSFFSPAGGTRGGSARTASAIARMCSGVVPQAAADDVEETALGEFLQEPRGVFGVSS